MKKWMIITIIIIYSFLICLIFYYAIENNQRKKRLENQVVELETKLEEYYKDKYDRAELGKLFIFPGETNIDFDDKNIISGEAFIYENGNIEIALYDGKYCAYKNNELVIKKDNISNCIVNRK